MAFDDRPSGDYFKPAEHKSAWAILVETKRDAPNSAGYKGVKKDAVYADITVFTTEADLDGPGKAFRNQRIDSSLLQREMRDRIGIPGESVRILGQWQGDRAQNPSWVWRFPEEAVTKKVIEWYGRREAAIAAIATPDFLN